MCIFVYRSESAWCLIQSQKIGSLRSDEFIETCKKIIFSSCLLQIKIQNDRHWSFFGIGLIKQINIRRRGGPLDTSLVQEHTLA